MQKSASKILKNEKEVVFLVITILRKLQTELWPILSKNTTFLAIKSAIYEVEHSNVGIICSLTL